MLELMFHVSWKRHLHSECRWRFHHGPPSSEHVLYSVGHLGDFLNAIGDFKFLNYRIARTVVRAVPSVGAVGAIASTENKRRPQNKMRPFPDFSNISKTDY